MARIRARVWDERFMGPKPKVERPNADQRFIRQVEGVTPQAPRVGHVPIAGSIASTSTRSRAERRRFDAEPQTSSQGQIPTVVLDAAYWERYERDRSEQQRREEEQRKQRQAQAEAARKKIADEKAIADFEDGMILAALAADGMPPQDFPAVAGRVLGRHPKQVNNPDAYTFEWALLQGERRQKDQEAAARQKFNQTSYDHMDKTSVNRLAQEWGCSVEFAQQLLNER